MSPIQRMAAQAALKNMLSGRGLNICTIRDILKMMGCVGDRETMQVPEVLHCVSYQDMDAALLEELPNLLARLFAGPILDVDRANIVFDAPSKSLRLVKRS